MGDGTGCDNMTAVIVQFRAALENEPSTLERETILESPITNDTSRKGEAGDVEMDKEKDEEEDYDQTQAKEEVEDREKNVSGAKKRDSKSSDSGTEDNLSPKQKKMKVDCEPNGVQV